MTSPYTLAQGVKVASASALEHTVRPKAESFDRTEIARLTLRHGSGQCKHPEGAARRVSFNELLGAQVLFSTLGMKGTDHEGRARSLARTSLAGSRFPLSRVPPWQASCCTACQPNIPKISPAHPYSPSIGLLTPFPPQLSTWV